MEEVDANACFDDFKKQFRLANFSPTREKTHLFVDSQWSHGSLKVTYVIYRIAVAVLLVTWAVADLCVDADNLFFSRGAIWISFTTSWSFLVLVSNGIAMAISSTYHIVLVSYFGRDERELRMQTIGVGLSLQWILYNAASNSSIGGSIFFWVFVVAFDKIGFLRTPSSQLKHTLTFIYVVADIFINAVPIRVLHFVYPVALGLIYALFNAVYFANGGAGSYGHPHAYPIIDWGSRPAAAAVATCSVAVALSVLAQGILYGLYQIRILLYRKSSFYRDDQLEAVLPPKDDADDEGTGLNPSSASGPPSYDSVICMELKGGQTVRDE